MRKRGHRCLLLLWVVPYILSFLKIHSSLTMNNEQGHKNPFSVFEEFSIV